MHMHTRTCTHAHAHMHTCTRAHAHACTHARHVPTQVPTAPCELLVSDVTDVPEWLQLQPFPTLTFALKVTGKPPPEPEPEA
jgi:hypothetical protein